MNQFSEKDVLKAFFSIGRKKITKDLEAVTDEIALVREADRAHATRAPGSMEPLDVALSYHRQLLRGSLAWRTSHFAKELLLYLQVYPAYQIAELSCFVASSSGRLGDLASEMGQFASEAGLGSDEVLKPDNWPVDYRKAARASDELLSAVSETVFSEIMERYECDEILALFEADSVDFEISYEVGRRLMNPV
ncbi:hypothetical protein N9Z02_02270, partial [Akkermansiaceae bacterium]|nr:hypothetical protein [Akkermansiaceae bacterium]